MLKIAARRRHVLPVRAHTCVRAAPAGSSKKADPNFLWFQCFQQFPVESGRGGSDWIRLWKGAGEVAAVQSAPLPLLMRHFVPERKIRG